MANVTRTWIRENVQTLYGFGGQITLDNFEECLVGTGSIETTLTPAAVRGEIPIRDKFHILIPGMGWADAIPINENYNDTEDRPCTCGSGLPWQDCRDERGFCG